MDRLVETNRCLYLLLQLGMINDVFVVQRLFEHHDVKAIHPFEKIDIGERVGRVCITHQLNIRKGHTYLADDVNIPTRLNFDFDAAVTRLDLAVDFREQAIDRWLNTDGDTAIDLLALSS